MNAESLIPTATSLGAGFFAGIMLGYFVKKVLKILVFVAGGLIGILLYLQQQQIISKPKPIAKSKVLHQKYELPKGILCKSTNSNGVPKQQPKPNKEKVEEKLNHFLSNIKSNIVYISR